MRYFVLAVVLVVLTSSVAFALPIGASVGGEDDVSGVDPQPVYLVDPPDMVDDSAAVPLNLSDTAYLGSISSGVYQYFRDLVGQLPIGSHYVFYRADQYNYNLVYGPDLSLSGSTFSGGDVQVINYYSYSYNDRNTITRYDESGFTLRDPGAFVYTDLGQGYPRLFEGVTHREFTALLVVVVVACLYSFVVRILSSGR